MHRADLTGRDWVDLAAGPHELVMVVMTLHYFPPPRVRQLYREIRDVLTPGGLLLVAEPMPVKPPHPASPLTDPSGPVDDPWTAWWRETARDPNLGPALAERARMSSQASAEFLTTVDWHRAAARAAGFTASRPVCRHGDHVLLAVHA